MSSSNDTGLFDARYLAFLDTIPTLRPALHRYCTRMTGSVMDGEDVVQSALFNAYQRLQSFDSARPIRPWLFRIAHNACMDFLRRRAARRAAEADAAVDIDDVVMPPDAIGQDVERAIERLLLRLPPKERAAILLKDVFDYSLDEIAELIDSSVGGVKAALSRGRLKLTDAALAVEHTPRIDNRAPSSRILELYVERFNRRDWTGVRELISADARITIADRYRGSVDDAPYFAHYQRLAAPWRLEPCAIGGEPAIRIASDDGNANAPTYVVRIDVVDDHIVRITDYTHCAWLLLPLEGEPRLEYATAPD